MVEHDIRPRYNVENNTRSAIRGKFPAERRSSLYCIWQLVVKLRIPPCANRIAPLKFLHNHLPREVLIRYHHVPYPSLSVTVL